MVSWPITTGAKVAVTTSLLVALSGTKLMKATTTASLLSLVFEGIALSSNTLAPPSFLISTTWILSTLPSPSTSTLLSFSLGSLIFFSSSAAFLTLPFLTRKLIDSRSRASGSIVALTATAGASAGLIIAIAAGSAGAGASWTVPWALATMAASQAASAATTSSRRG